MYKCQMIADVYLLGHARCYRPRSLSALVLLNPKTDTHFTVLHFTAGRRVN